MAGYLTTHVLDTALGCPAERLKIELLQKDLNWTDALINRFLKYGDLPDLLE